MKNQKIDYTGKKVYVGIDVHKRTYSITAICESEVTKKTTMSAQPSMLALCFKSWFRGAKIHSVYEAGFSGFDLHRRLVKEGIQNIVVNPASVELAANDKVKNDQRDSKRLAEQLSIGRLTGIYIPTEQEELRRTITRTRQQIVSQRTRVALQIKSKLFLFGRIKA